MATTNITIPEQTWTEISTVGCDFQVLGDNSVYAVSAVSAPTDLTIKKNIHPKKIYSFAVNGSEKLFIYSPIGRATIACDEGISETTKDGSAYNPTTGANRIEEIDPITLHNVSEEHLINEVNQAVGTYTTVIDMKNFKNGSIQWVISGGVTMKIYMSNDPDETIIADITSLVTGASSQTDNDGVGFLDTNIRVGTIMIEMTTTDTSNATDVFISRGN